MKKVSAALLLTDGKRFLTVQPFGYKLLDIPKGEVEDNENPKLTLIREIKEECDLNLQNCADNIVDHGVHAYTKYKDIHLFSLKVNYLPDETKMKCTSTFDFYGKQMPEVRSHKYINFDSSSLLNPNMKKIVDKIRKEI